MIVMMVVRVKAFAEDFLLPVPVLSTQACLICSVALSGRSGTPIL